MRKVHLLILSLICMLLFCSSCNNDHFTNFDQNTPISEFMRGKWRAERQNSDIYGSYQEEFFVKFINARTLKFCSKEPVEQFCDNFRYTSIMDNLFLVENERTKGGYWTISRNNGNLQICIWEENNCVIFIRDTSKFNLPLEVFGIYR